MATQRYISTSFWDDRWIRSLNPSDRYLYLYLITNPLTNIAGVYRITIDRIAFDTGYDERALRPMLDKFEAAGKAHFHSDEWMILPAWPRHQQWQKRSKIRDGIISVLQDCPRDVLSVAMGAGYDFDFSAVDNTIIATKVRTGVSGATRKKVIDASSGTCARCGADSVDLEIHHKTPIKEGGDSSIDNLEALCSDCHKKEHSPDRVYGRETSPDRVYRLETQSIYGPNYSDLDLDTDIDLSIPAASATAEESSVSTAKEPRALSPMKDPIADEYQQAMTAETPAEAWKSIPQERKQLDKLGSLTQQLSRVTGIAASDLVAVVLDEYKTMRRNNRAEYWRAAPYTPSALVTRWDQVIESVKQKHAEPMEILF